MSAHRIRISKGNVKVGAVPSISLPPVITCAPKIPCALKCYARKMIARRANIGASYQANLDYLLADPESFFDDLSRFLSRSAPALFRFHVSGDFISGEHLGRALSLARSFSEIRFLAFSKRFEFFPSARSLPKNFSLIASLWSNWGERPKGYRAAYMRDPRSPDSRIPRSAIHCSGGCESCGMCWDLRKLKRDVYFDLH